MSSRNSLSYPTALLNLSIPYEDCGMNLSLSKSLVGAGHVSTIDATVVEDGVPKQLRPSDNCPKVSYPIGQTGSGAINRVTSSTFRKSISIDCTHLTIDKCILSVCCILNHRHQKMSFALRWCTLRTTLLPPTDTPFEHQRVSRRSRKTKCGWSQLTESAILRHRS